MDKRFDKLEEKLDKIAEDIGEMKVVQASQAKDLKYHIMRTDLSETRINTIEDRLMPLIKIKTKIEGTFQFLGVVGACCGFVFSAVKFAEFILQYL